LKRRTAVEPQDLSVRRERTDPESLREQASVGFSYQGLTTRSWHNGSSTLCPTHRISDTLVAWHFRADPCSSVACPFRVDPCSSVACPFRVDPVFIRGVPFPCSSRVHPWLGISVLIPGSSMACHFRVNPCSSVACPFRVHPVFIRGLGFPC